MPLLDDIATAWKEALKARDKKKDVLSAIRTEVKNKVINTRTEGGGEITAPDDVVIDVLGKMAKQRREAIDEFTKGGRQDLVEKEAYELSVIESYLPKQMDPAALADVVKATIAEIGATTPKDMGRAMKAVMEKVKGKADGKDVQAAVKVALGG
jgi:uncharacterized protein